MTDRANMIRAQQVAERKAARENASVDFKAAVALEQIAEGIFSLRDEVQDLRAMLQIKK